MKPNSKEFKALEDVWYKKLTKSGFEDSEQRDGMLKSSSQRVFKGKSNGSYYEDKVVYYKSVEEYYRLAGHFLHDYDFADKKERLIWELHAEGHSIKEITKRLKAARFKVHSRKVHTTIQTLVKKMKLTCL